MAKMTKTQKRNTLSSIRAKAFKLLGDAPELMSVNDYAAIAKIIEKGFRKMK